MKIPTPSALHPFYERFFMRLAFAWVVVLSTPSKLNVHSLPAPNGVARLVDLSFLINPKWLGACHVALLIALGFYGARVLLWLALPIIFAIHVALNAVVNSQGAIHHAPQIVSLVLLAQTAAYYYDWWLRRGGAAVQCEMEERQIFWTQQAIAATYFVAGLTKLIASDGAWIFRARFIGVQIFKTAYQAYYNTLNPAGLNEQLGLAQFAAEHGVLLASICALGLGLELLAPLILLGRWWGLILGLCLLAFHLSIASLMQLAFLFHRLLLLIYVISPIFWIVWAASLTTTMGRKNRPSPTSP